MRILSFLLAAVLLLVSAPLLAESVTAPGKVFYKMPGGEIVKRNVSLSVPARGQGDVTLTAGDFELTADRFFTRRSAGRSIFYVVFKDIPQAPEGTTAVYKGTYTRGSNNVPYNPLLNTKNHTNGNTIKKTDHSKPITGYNINNNAAYADIS